MANYFSVSSGGINDSGVFNRSISIADQTSGSTSYALNSRYFTNCLPIPGDNTIYGVAVHLYFRSNTPTGTFDLQIVSPNGSIVSSETYNISLFTSHDGRDNTVTLHPQNWQILSLSAPLYLADIGNHFLRVKTSNDNELELIGKDIAFNEVNFERFNITGNLNDATPFNTFSEKSARSPIIPASVNPNYAVGAGDFTIEGFYYFNGFNPEWTPLINLGTGWDRAIVRGPVPYLIGEYSSWGIAYNESKKRLYFYRLGPRGERVSSAYFPLLTNRWYHIAVSRNNNTLKIWVDGVCISAEIGNRVNYAALRRKKLQIGTFKKRPTILSPGDDVTILKTFDSDMYVSNIRITPDVDRYSNALTVPVDPLSLRIDTPLLYSHPNSDYYLTTDASGTITEKYFDITAIIFNDIDELQFTHTGTITQPITTNNPYVDSNEYSLNLTGASIYVSNVSYGNFTTGDFTLEMWVNPSDVTGTRRLCTYSTNSNLTANQIFGIEIISGTLSAFTVSSAKAKSTLTQGTITTGVWQHIAFVRQNTTVTTYINGVATGPSLTIPNKLNKLVSPVISFGAERNRTIFYKGSLTGLRLIKGKALYTSDFNSITPASGTSISAPEPPVNYISSNTTVDDLVVQPAVYDVVTPSDSYISTPTLVVSTNTPITGENSISFARSLSDTVVLPLDYTNPANIGGTDFTIEAWINLSSLPANETAASSYTMYGINSSVSDGYAIILTKTKIYLALGNHTTKVAESTHNLSINTWYHVACVRKNQYVKFYINGVYLGNTSTFNGINDYTISSTSKIYIGSRQATTSCFDGLISNLRLIRGTCLYNADFNVTPVADGANITNPAALAAYISTAGRGTYTVTNTIKSSTNVPHSGLTSSLQFSKNVYIDVVNEDNAYFGSADFTVECWVNVPAAQYKSSILSFEKLGLYIGDASGANDFTIRADVTGVVSSLQIGTLTANQWSHIAVVREGTSIRFYQDGALTQTRTVSISLGSTSDFSIGRFRGNSSGTFTFEGNIADIRVVRGAAVYPTATFPTALDTAPLQSVTSASSSMKMSRSFGIAPYLAPYLADLYPPVFTSPTKSMQFTNNDGSGNGRDGGEIITQETADMSGDFTVEAWIYPTGGRHFCSYFEIFRAEGGWSFGIYFAPFISSQGERLGFTTGLQNCELTAKMLYATQRFTLFNTWSHVAVSRQGNNWYIFINGILVPQSVYPVSDAAAFKQQNFTSPGVIKVGKRTSGLITSALLTTGTAKYTSDFSVPTSPYVKTSSAEVLFNPLANSTRIVAGDATSFYGASTSIYTADVPQAVTGDFLLDFHFRPRRTGYEPEVWLETGRSNSSVSPFSTNLFMKIGINPPNEPAPTSLVSLYNGVTTAENERKLWVMVHTAECYATQYISTNKCINYDQWNYVAIIRSGAGSNNITVYVNGEAQITFSDTKVLDSYLTIGSALPRRFCYGSGDSNRQPPWAKPIIGDISSIRIDRDITKYNAPFNPSSSTVFLYKPENSSTSYITGPTTAYQFSKMPAPFLSEGSLYFTDAMANSYVLRKHIDDSLLHVLPFTVEGWFYLTSDTSADSRVLSIWQSSDTDADKPFILGTRNMQLVLRINTGSIVEDVLDDDVTLSVKTWYYFALSQDNNYDLRLYIGAFGEPEARCIGVAKNNSWFMTGKYNTKTLLAAGLTGYISNVRESREALYTSDNSIDIPASPLSVTSSTIALYTAPYLNNEYTYHENASSSLYKTNSNAFTDHSPFPGLDGSISNAYAILPTDFNPDLNIGTQDFTLEWWCKIITVKNNVFPVISIGSIYNDANCILGARFTKSTTGVVDLKVKINGVDISLTIPGGIALNEWHHCAVVRNSGTLSFYIGGNSTSRSIVAAAAAFIDTPNNDGVLGALYASATSVNRIDGYLSNIRLVVGTALYPNNDVPTGPLDNIEGTALLYKYPYNNTYLGNGKASTVSLLKTQSAAVFYPSPDKTSELEDCMFFSGVDLLQLPDNITTNYNLGVNNEPFTIEMWVLAVKATGTQMLLSRGGGYNSWSTYGNAYALYLSGNTLLFQMSAPGNTYYQLSYGRFGLDKLRDWAHIAVSYDGAVTSMYVDGIKVAGLATPHTYTYAKKNTGIFRLGGHQGYLSSNLIYRFSGYMSNVRIIKGDCIYAGSTPFEPENILSGTPNTILLLQAPYENNLEFKFQGSPFDPNYLDSVPFIDGSKFLKTADPLPAMTGDFTIEFWFYCLRGPVGKTYIRESILDGRSGSGAKTPFAVQFNTVAKKIRVYVGTSSPTAATSAEFLDVGNITAKTWHHFVIQRENNIVSLYQNGELQATLHSAATWGGNPLLIGKQYVEPGYTNTNFIGYLSNLRIVNNEAVYSASKPFPAYPLAADADTSFLLKTGTDFDRGIITTQTDSLSADLLPRIKNDAAYYTAFTEKNPWGDNSTDYLIFPGNYTNSYLKFAANEKFNLYQSHFTFEAYIYHIVTQDNLCGGWQPNGGFVTPWYQTIFTTAGLIFYINCEGYVGMYSNGAYRISTVDVEAFQWTHIAFVGDPTTNGGKVTLYIDGENVFEWGPEALPVPSTYPYMANIGTELTEGYVWWPRGHFSPRFKGYMSNIRLMRSEIIRNATDLTGLHVFNNIASTSTYLAPNSYDENYPGSIYFNGSTSAFLSSTTRADVFAGNFTIELFINIDLGAFSGYKSIISQGADWAVKVNSEGFLQFYGRTANVGGTTVVGSITITSTAGAVLDKEWTHIAVTKEDDGDIFLFANNILVASGNSTKQIGIPATKSLNIGGTMRGFMSNIRINNSSALYNTGTITPTYPLSSQPGDVLLVRPATTSSTFNYTAPYTDEFTPPQGALTKLPGTVFLLQHPYNVQGVNTYTSYSASVVPSANPNTNSDAYSFNGNSYIYLHNFGINGVYKDKFTINFWFKPEKVPTSPTVSVLIYKENNYYVFFTSTNRVGISINENTTITGDIVLPLNVWHHVSVVCDGSRVVLFVNGVKDRIIFGTPTLTTHLDANIVLGASRVRTGTGIPRVEWYNRRPPQYWFDAPVVDSSFTGQMSDIYVQKGTQMFNTDISVTTDIFSLAADTLFQYQPSYGTNVYTTSSGSTNFVLNTVPADDVGGLLFLGDGTRYLKTQILPACAAGLTTEMWIYPTRTTSRTEVLMDGRNASTDIPWYIALNLNGTFNVGLSCGNRVVIKSANNSYKPNTWNHIAVIRTKTTVALYLNQKLIDVTKSTVPWFGVPLMIGRSAAGTLPYTGKIYSMRVVKDTDIYDTEFDPALLPAITANSKTQALIAGNNIYSSDVNYFRYQSQTSGKLNLRGNSPVTGENGSIMHLMGAEYIAIPHNDLLNLANEAWSIEFWLMLPIPHRSDVGPRCVLRKASGLGILQKSYAVYIETTGTVKFSVSTTNNTGAPVDIPAISSTTPLPVDRWVHVSLASDGNTTELYIDGKYNFTYPYTPGFNISSPLYIGDVGEPNTEVNYGSAFINPLWGYISNLRIVKGLSAYASSIDVPVAPYPDNNIEDIHFDDVSLLLHGSGANNSTTILDSSTNNYLLSANGNCAISTTNQYFEFTSIKFDGSGDYISSTNFKDAGVFNLDDFTVEFWIYANAAPQGNQCIVSFSKSSLNGFAVRYSTTSIDVVYNNASILSATGARWSLNTWRHVAISRTAGRISLFVNGDFVRTVPFNINLTDGLQFIGRYFNTPTSYNMSGYIDELRITKGVGRYTADFIVPTEPLKAPINTGLILQAPYVENTYGLYGVENIHIGGNLNQNTLTPITIQLDNSVTLNNLFIHNGGTLYVPKNEDVSLNIIGPAGLHITSDGVLNIN